ncbi:PREDICTED: protein FAM173A isoform X1 [Condylura cristata]|uniref:protein FAM173A isoform X1 n=1 Tax=Condylura cristata TaxID=143302 RepID=UPI000642B9B3|nr:PREDICTED: protein FAM173A isoform X1 [Condylura cristata]
MVDLGSGDGRIVLAAHRCGLRPAVGYELNPWLLGLARLHAWRAGCAGRVSFRREDLWKVSLRDCHNVSVFLAPSVVSSPWLPTAKSPVSRHRSPVRSPAGPSQRRALVMAARYCPPGPPRSCYERETTRHFPSCFRLTALSSVRAAAEGTAHPFDGCVIAHGVSTTSF